MKRILSGLLFLIPMFAFAQMNEADMEKMMQKMQEMETCMQNIDQSKLASIEQRARKMEAEIKSLCENGKRDMAMKKAMDFSQEIMSNPTMKTVRKCGEMMQGVMPKMPMMDFEEDQKNSTQHICD